MKLLFLAFVCVGCGKGDGTAPDPINTDVSGKWETECDTNGRIGGFKMLSLETSKKFTHKRFIYYGGDPDTCLPDHLQETGTFSGTYAIGKSTRYAAEIDFDYESCEVELSSYDPSPKIDCELIRGLHSEALFRIEGNQLLISASSGSEGRPSYIEDPEIYKRVE